MPVLNGAQFLDEAICSVRQQSWQDWRLTIFDAGSSDSSVAIARAHRVEDDRISLVEEPDTGQYDALRRGLDLAEGDVLGWLNADDKLTPWAFSSVAREFERGSLWVTGQPALWDGDGRMVALRPTGYMGQHFLKQGWHHDGLLGCLQQESTLFAKSLWDQLPEAVKDRFSRMRLAGDFYLWTQFASVTRLTILPISLGGFRVHDSNRSRTNAVLYQQEAQTCGATLFPNLISHTVRKVYDVVSAVAALYRFRSAAARFHAELDPLTNENAS